MTYARHGRVGLRTWVGKHDEIVCFPCAGGDSLGFRSFASALDDRYQVTAVDLPGHGGSQGPPVSSFANLIQWCASALAQRPRIPLAVLGHSFGGYLAVAVLRRMNRLDARWANVRLILSSTVPPEVAASLPSPSQHDEDLIAQLVTLGGIPKEIAEDPVVTTYLPRIRADLAAAEEYVHSRSQWAGESLPNRALIVTGAKDPICRPDLAAQWAKLMPDATTMSLDADHYIPQSAPNALASAVGTWLTTPGITTKPQVLVTA